MKNSYDISISKAIIIAAVVIAFAIIVSPIALQKYKMKQCLDALEQLGYSPTTSDQSTCMNFIK
jgi:hypothetical protein